MAVGLDDGQIIVLGVTESFEPIKIGSKSVDSERAREVITVSFRTYCDVVGGRRDVASSWALLRLAG